MKKILLIFVLLLGLTQAKAQNYYNFLDTTTLGVSKTKIINNNLYFSQLIINPVGTRAVVVSKNDINNFGLILKDTLTPDSIVSNIGSFKKWKNKLVIFSQYDDLNNYIDGNGNINFTNYYADVMLIVMDTNFNVLYQKIYNHPNQDNAADLLVKNNAFYLLGSKFVGNDVQAFFTKTDTLGNVIWETTFGGNNVDYGMKIKPINDSLFFVFSINTEIYDLVITLIDDNGNILFQKNIEYATNDNLDCVTLLYNQSFLLPIRYNNGTEGRLINVNFKGDILWEKQFFYNNTATPFAFVDPIENNDGTILLYGAILDSVTSNPLCRVLKLDPLGNELWHKDYFVRTDRHQYFYDIKPTADGGYIMAGSAFPPGPTNVVNQQAAWVLKTNCLGEEGVQYPISGNPCVQYDCSQYPTDANFAVTKTYIDLAVSSGEVFFTNNSINTTNRVWQFGDGDIDYTNPGVYHTYTSPGVYEAKLITYHGTCSDTATQIIEVVNSLGLNEKNQKNNKLLVYPNPNNGEFTINFKNLKNIEKILVFNSFGQLVQQLTLNSNNEVLFNNYASGVYHIIVYTNGQTYQQKIIVN